MTERHVSQRDLAEILNCSQGRVAKILNGGVMLRVNDLAILADAVGITVVEALRDRGFEFYAELTPSEVRVLERLRRRPNALRGVMMILDLPTQPDPEKPVEKKRHATRAAFAT